VDVIKAGSVEVSGLKLEEVPLRNKGQKDPNLEFYTFQPYVSDTVNNKIYYCNTILCTYLMPIMYINCEKMVLVITILLNMI